MLNTKFILQIEDNEFQFTRLSLLYDSYILYMNIIYDPYNMSLFLNNHWENRRWWSGHQITVIEYWIEALIWLNALIPMFWHSDIYLSNLPCSQNLIFLSSYSFKFWYMGHVTWRNRVPAMVLFHDSWIMKKSDFANSLSISYKKPLIITSSKKP